MTLGRFYPIGATVVALATLIAMESLMDLTSARCLQDGDRVSDVGW